MKHILAITALLFVSSCGTSKTKLSSDGQKVKVLLSKSKNCDVLNKVVGENEGGSEELAKNHARNLAGKHDADAVHFDEVVQNGSMIKVFATAYRCNKED